MPDKITLTRAQLEQLQESVSLIDKLLTWGADSEANKSLAQVATLDPRSLSLVREASTELVRLVGRIGRG
jgi:hypothetical protein